MTTMKLKNHSGASKRMKRRASGSIKFRRANRSHINARMSSKLKRNIRRAGTVGASHLKAIKHLID